MKTVKLYKSQWRSLASTLLNFCKNVFLYKSSCQCYDYCKRVLQKVTMSEHEKMRGLSKLKKKLLLALLFMLHTCIPIQKQQQNHDTFWYSLVQWWSIYTTHWQSTHSSTAIQSDVRTLISKIWLWCYFSSPVQQKHEGHDACYSTYFTIIISV